MKISVTARPNAKEEKVVKLDEGHFEVAVKEPPVRGLANAAIRQALAGFLGIAAGRITLVSGFSSRRKVFLID